jgi:hypothetical protein
MPLHQELLWARKTGKNTDNGFRCESVTIRIFQVDQGPPKVRQNCFPNAVPNHGCVGRDIYYIPGSLAPLLPNSDVYDWKLE